MAALTAAEAAEAAAATDADAEAAAAVAAARTRVPPEWAPLAPSQRRALWYGARLQQAASAAVARAPPLGRSVELLRLQQLVLAHSNLAPPEKPGVPGEATLRPFASGRGEPPLLLLAPCGAGKTALVAHLLTSLRRDAPALRIAVHFSAAGGGGFDLLRVALTQLALQLAAHDSGAAAE